MKWEDPPRGARTASREAEAAQLRAHPGQWARLAEDLSTSQAASLAQSIRAGILRNFQPRGAFEAVSRKGAVYARYTGEGGS